MDLLFNLLMNALLYFISDIGCDLLNLFAVIYIRRNNIAFFSGGSSRILLCELGGFVCADDFFALQQSH